MTLKLFDSIYSSVLFPNSYKLAMFFPYSLQALHICTRTWLYDSATRKNTGRVISGAY